MKNKKLNFESFDQFELNSKELNTLFGGVVPPPPGNGETGQPDEPQIPPPPPPNNGGPFLDPGSILPDPNP